MGTWAAEIDGAPRRLRIEHGPRPLGVGCAAPRLSWWLSSEARGQIAYRVEATVDGGELHAGGEVADTESILRPWPFPRLTSRCQVDWRVQVRTESGWSPWSAFDHFEVGLLDVADWQARFVTHPDDGVNLAPRGERGAIYLRRRIHVTDVPAKARIYATAHGLYELSLDGKRLGDLELTPGFTAYRAHLEVQTYDVTDLLAAGEHTLAATLTDGWWRGSVGFNRDDCSYGTRLGLLLQLELFDEAGNRTVVATDDTWEAGTEGPIAAADLMEGQRVDLRTPFLPAEGWDQAIVVGEPDRRLCVSPAPPTRVTQVYRPVSVTRLDRDRQVVDLGADINGRARLPARVLGALGNRVRLRHGERLGDDGDVDTSHLEVERVEIDRAALREQVAATGSFDISSIRRVPLGPGQVDEVVSAGPDGPGFEPHHTTHGFQYVSVEGAVDLSPDDVTGAMVHTDMVRTGWFKCSDPRLNALHEATVLSFRGNACEIPTDCPQRERAGWTGDWQIFVPSAALIYDVAGFSDRWLRDLAADQWDDGRVPNFVPEPYDPAGREVVARFMTGSAGWGDAAVLVPYEIWRSYGDVELLARQYSSMQRWVEFGLRRAATRRHPDRAVTRPEPAPHEHYLWDVGFHWGEWLEPGGSAVDVFTDRPDFGDVATAYLCRSLAALAEIAALLGRDGDAARYGEMAGEVRAAWQAEYVSSEGTVKPLTQANLVRALAFDLIDDRHRDEVAAELVKLIRDAGTHLGTGFLSTPFLLPVLADNGYLDVAYDLLLQTTPPSWLAMIAAGATTVWENWEGLDDNGQGSLNHYSKGAVISFLHRYVAGLRPVPGVPAYRRFEVHPRPGGDLTHAHARLDTPYGTISSAWVIEDDTFTLDVQVAPGTRATVTLPDKTTHECPTGTYRFATSKGE